MSESVSREELLRGLGGRRTSTLLFAIESKTAYLVRRATHVAAPAICDDLAEAREKNLLAALASGRELPARVRIHDLERFAGVLGQLVPADPQTRADLAYRIAAKYPARESDVPGVRAMLGLHTPEVVEELRARHGVSPSDLWVAHPPARRERLRWAWARMAQRLEQLPPFWTSFGLTLTQTVGAGVLALPIALASVGPLVGVALIAVLGAVNVLTIAMISESLTRTGQVRWGGAYLGQVVGRYLGPGAQAVLSLALIGIAVVALLAYYVGLSSVLDAATGVPTIVWASVLFAVTVGAVWRGRLDATIASSLLVGGVNVVVLLALSTLALANLETDNLARVGASSGAFEPAEAAAAFGVILLAFFGHTSVANCARVVLRRERSGRSLLRGAVAGMCAAAMLYGIWTLAVTGAVSTDRLADETGTALEPLAEATGPAVLAIGSVFAVLAMGMAAVHFSLGLYFQTREVVRGDGIGTRLACIVPLVAVFVTASVLLLTDQESFTGSLGTVGTLAVPFIAGVIPVLLFASTRRQGDSLPEPPSRLLARGWLGTPVCAIFILALFAHAAVIWSSPPARAAAAAAAVGALLIAVRVVRTGALHPIVSVELRRERHHARYRVRVVAGGEAAQVPVRADGAEVTALDERGAGYLPGRCASVQIDLAPTGMDQLWLWTHEIDPAGDSTPMAVEPHLDQPAGRSTLELVDGEGAAPLSQPAHLTVDLPLMRRTSGPGHG